MRNLEIWEDRQQSKAEMQSEKVVHMRMQNEIPNWQLLSMIRKFRKRSVFHPLGESDPVKDNQITVCIRKRPLNKRELARNEVDVISVSSNDEIVVHEEKKKLNHTKYLENHHFKFDYVFDESCDNKLVYNYTAKPLVQNVFDGGISTCFAFGQAGSGKTHAMGGGKTPDSKEGIYAMTAEDVFNFFESPKYKDLNLLMSASFFEIYRGEVFDLLANRARLPIREDNKLEVQMVGLTEEVVDSLDELLELIEHVKTTRTSGKSSAYSRSSRSHVVFQIVIRKTGTKAIHGKLSLIDLAGNEKIDIPCWNYETRIEVSEINKSLLVLRECIRALGRSGDHIPFRENKLTDILRDSFIGRNSKVCIMGMICPGLRSCSCSLNTLRFADRVKEQNQKLEEQLGKQRQHVNQQIEQQFEEQPQEHDKVKEELQEQEQLQHQQGDRKIRQLYQSAVEREKENWEEHRKSKAKLKKEKVARMRIYDVDPIFQLRSMIRKYRDSSLFHPLGKFDIVKDNKITVCIRKRPLDKPELARKELDVISVPNKEEIVVHEKKNKLNHKKCLKNHHFRFDYVFDETCSNDLVYNYTAKPLVQNIFEGGISTCFAYGQTGSGKTHTMGGGKTQASKKGIYAMTAEEVFKFLESPKYKDLNLLICASFFEIYCGEVFDLLANRSKLHICENHKLEVQIVGLTEEVADSVDELLELIEHGKCIRTSGKTPENSYSSRSHAVFQIIVRKIGTKTIHGKLSLIDLAGNERTDTLCSNYETRLEGSEINKSLLALRECIRALGRCSFHIPFRDSKLTHVLRDSFIRENSKTCIIATICPGIRSCSCSLNTLRFADRVKEHKNKMEKQLRMRRQELRKHIEQQLQQHPQKEYCMEEKFQDQQQLQPQQREQKLRQRYKSPIDRWEETWEKQQQRKVEIKENKLVRMKMYDVNSISQLCSMLRNYRDSSFLHYLGEFNHVKENKITVCIRKRPFTKAELSIKEVDVVSAASKAEIVVFEKKEKLKHTKCLGNQRFRFDYVFDENCGNSLVYNYTAKPLVQHIFEGGMATCFAYGQTGSGKTHTMSGGKTHDSKKGIYAMAAEEVFKFLVSPKYKNLHMLISACFFDIYRGDVFDLLANRTKLHICENHKLEAQVMGLTEEVAYSVDELLKLIEHGKTARTSGKTSAYSYSSGSHTVFQIVIRKNGTKAIHGKLSLIDLAGNERMHTSCSNYETRIEGAEIRKSLLALRECIRALGRGDTHIPFRDSLLTHILRDSLVGKNSKTCLIGMICPGMRSCLCSLNTLRFANRVKEQKQKSEEEPEKQRKELNLRIERQLEKRPQKQFKEEEEFQEQQHIQHQQRQQNFQQQHQSTKEQQKEIWEHQQIKAEQKEGKAVRLRTDNRFPKHQLSYIIRKYRNSSLLHSLQESNPVRGNQIIVRTRKRQLSKAELARKDVDEISVQNNEEIVVQEENYELNSTKCLERQHLRFDCAIDETYGNNLVCNYPVRPLVRNTFDDGKTTCFAYGQTGSGITHTMDCSKTLAKDIGKYTMTVEDALKFLQSPKSKDLNLMISANFAHTYRDEGFDLSAKRTKLPVREDHQLQVQVVRHKKEAAFSMDELLQLSERAKSARISGKNFKACMTGIICPGISCSYSVNTLQYADHVKEEKIKMEEQFKEERQQMYLQFEQEMEQQTREEKEPLQEEEIVDVCEEVFSPVDKLLQPIEHGKYARTSRRMSANFHCSRSQAEFQRVFLNNGANVNRGTLPLIDLADNVTGELTLRLKCHNGIECAEINKSLLALNECITVLVRNDIGIPFGGSKLIHIVRDPLTRKEFNTCTIISPESSLCGYSLNTLFFAGDEKELKQQMVEQLEEQSQQLNQELRKQLQEQPREQYQLAMTSVERDRWTGTSGKKGKLSIQWILETQKNLTDSNKLRRLNNYFLPRKRLLTSSIFLENCIQEELQMQQQQRQQKILHHHHHQQRRRWRRQSPQQHRHCGVMANQEAGTVQGRRSILMK